MGLTGLAIGLISCIATNSHFVDVFLLRDIGALLPLLQSSFLKLLDHLLVALCLTPFEPSRIEHSLCLFKQFARLVGAHMKAENISFAVLNHLASGVVQVGNLCPDLPNLPILFFRSRLTDTHLLLRFVNARFGRRHVRLTHFHQPVDALEALFLFRCHRDCLSKQGEKRRTRGVQV